MSRAADRAFPEVDTVFDPPLYTDDELRVIEANLGDTPGVAKTSEGFPTTPDSIPAVVNALQRFYDLQQLSEMGRVEGWVGFEKVREHIGQWLERQRRYMNHKANDPGGKGFHPEMHTFDSRGKAHWAGPGSSSGRVRKPLALVSIDERNEMDFTKGIGEEEVESPKGDGPTYVREVCIHPNKGEEDPIESYIQCPVCERRFEYNAESKLSENSGWARLGKHLASTKDEADAHRLARREIFS